MSRGVVFPSSSRRLVAGLIDSVVTLYVWPIAAVAAALLQSGEVYNTDFLLRAVLIALLLLWMYFTCLECSPLQATVGKRIMGIQVVDLQGRDIDFERSSVRFLLRVLNIALLGAGTAVALWSPRGRALHDLATRTAVISARATHGQARVGWRRATRADVLGVGLISACSVFVVFSMAIPMWNGFHQMAAVHRGIAAVEPYLEMIASDGTRTPSQESPSRSLRQLMLEKAAHRVIVYTPSNGKVVIDLLDEDVKGVRIVFEPRIEAYLGNRFVAWSCRSKDVDAWMLPYRCRSTVFDGPTSSMHPHGPIVLTESGD